MKKQLLSIVILFISLNLFSQTCGTGGCAATATNSTGQYPTTTFSTTSSSWSTVSTYMNAGNFTLFNVTSGNVYEWTYCSDFGGSMGWDAELTLFNNSTGVTLCHNDNCGISTCSTAPYIRWTATFTGTVKLLTTVSGCGTNTGSPYSTLVWRDTSGTPTIQILGVDVYSGNSTINWAQVKAAGYTFAWAKATEGVGYTDSEYLNYAVNGVAAGMKMGAYHFARPDLNPTDSGAIAEANYFLSIAHPYITTCQLPPALDLEGSYLETSFTSIQLTAWVQNWMNTVEAATGIKPVLYIGSSTCSYVNSSLNTYPLWRDDVNGNPSTPPANIGVWTTWAINQYSWTGTVPGITGSQTDLNVFNGNTTAAFNSFMGCSTTGINQVAAGNNIQVNIYPNPAKDMLIIESLIASENSTLIITDMLGNNVKQVSFNTQHITFNIGDLNEGIYNINITNQDGAVNKRLVITR